MTTRSTLQDQQGRAALLALCEQAGYERADAPLLMDAGLVLDLAGEGLGRTLFLTSDDDGNELCLRPDFTFPLVLAHLSQAQWTTPAALSYCGPVFRKARGASGEVQQAGIESLGRTDLAQADADVVAVALQGARLVCAAPQISMGDVGLFADLTAALGLSAAWQRRLLKDFRRNGNLAHDLTRLAAQTAGGTAYSGLLRALEGTDPKGARALVTDLLSIAGIKAVGGRSVGEIAERFLEQAAMGSEGLDAQKITVIEKVLAVDAPAPEALAAIAAIVEAAGLALAPTLTRLNERFAALKARGVDPAGIRFRPAFSRDFDYYTGMVFTLTDASGAELAGGGRYDRLTDHLARRLGREAGVPAVGCAFALDRFAGAAS